MMPLCQSAFDGARFDRTLLYYDAEKYKIINVSAITADVCTNK